MQVSKEEILHIAKLANLELQENEIQKYIDNLQDILNFAEVVNNANTDNLDITIGTNITFSLLYIIIASIIFLLSSTFIFRKRNIAWIMPSFL